MDTSGSPSHLLLLTAICAVMLLVTGCLEFKRDYFKPLPGPGRDGRLYCYTADYSNENSTFSLVGKTIVKSDRALIIPLPGTLFPGLPLYGLEKYVICPVVDTLLIPYDLYLKARNAYVCANDGIWITIVDCNGQPVPNLNVNVFFSTGYTPTTRRVVYDGKPAATNRTLNFVTDEKGEFYIPVDLDSCEGVNLRGRAQTSFSDQGEEFHAVIERYYDKHLRNGMSLFNGRYSPYHYLGFYCSHKDCRSRFVDFQWTDDGLCTHCHRPLSAYAARLRSYDLRKHNVKRPICREDYLAITPMNLR